MASLNDIRSTFLDFFEKNGHRVVEITRIALTEGGTTHRFKATAAMMPNSSRTVVTPTFEDFHCLHWTR